MRTDPDSAHRARVLRELGIVPWMRRPSLHGDGPDAGDAMSALAPGTVACVLVLPHGCLARELDLIGRALNACGPVLARAARVIAREGQLVGDVPEARAYLVFGEAQAHALGRSLPATVMHRAQIILADEPAQVLGSAAAKRRLWNALRGVRRALAGGEG
jgi:hypothetical protein